MHQDILDQIGNDIVKGVVGNKTDLFISEAVSEEEAEDYAKSINAKFLSISAKNDSHIKFEDYLRELLKGYISKNPLQNVKNIKLKKEININQRKEKKGCDKFADSLAEALKFKNIIKYIFTKK